MSNRDEALDLARDVIRLGRDDEEAEILARALIESEAALQKYAQHPMTCSSMVIRFTNGPMVPCDCGLDAALRCEEVRDG